MIDALDELNPNYIRNVQYPDFTGLNAGQQTQSISGTVVESVNNLSGAVTIAGGGVLGTNLAVRFTPGGGSQLNADLRGAGGRQLNVMAALADFAGAFSATPTQAECQALATFVNTLLGRLRTANLMDL